jgi:hypothetical protein
MIALTAQTRIWIAREPADFRCGMVVYLLSQELSCPLLDPFCMKTGFAGIPARYRCVEWYAAAMLSGWIHFHFWSSDLLAGSINGNNTLLNIWLRKIAFSEPTDT